MSSHSNDFSRRRALTGGAALAALAAIPYARSVRAQGRVVVKAGGPTVKNVSGFDLPRLLVGSLGTIGVLVEAVLRAQPRPTVAAWYRTDRDPFALRRTLHRPSRSSSGGRGT